MTGFADVGCTMMTKERWRAAKFVQGQMHVIACNDYVCTDALKQLPRAPKIHTRWLLSSANILAKTSSSMPASACFSVVLLKRRSWFHVSAWALLLSFSSLRVVTGINRTATPMSPYVQPSTRTCSGRLIMSMQSSTVNRRLVRHHHQKQ